MHQPPRREFWNPSADLASNHIEGQFSPSCDKIETRELCAPAGFPGALFSLQPDKFLKTTKLTTMTRVGVPFFPYLFSNMRTAGEV